MLEEGWRLELERWGLEAGAEPGEGRHGWVIRGGSHSVFRFRTGSRPRPPSHLTPGWGCWWRKEAAAAAAS